MAAVLHPYFNTNHLTSVLLLVVTLGWLMMELSHAGRSREGATGAGGGGRRLTVVPVVIVASVMLFLGPRFIPAAAIRPGVAAFAVGMVVMVGGLVLRGWSIKTLGEYFTGQVLVSADQPVITAGPYRLLRHPSYTGLLVACVGLGLTSANWAAVATLVVLPTAAVLWRIHAEENALLGTLGDRYRAYAGQRKRLIPLVW
jgi:protein-S-isoprenylcysteine O-methyltransferase Ste14